MLCYVIQYGLLVFRQNDEVSVDVIDVHAAAYQQLSHSIPMYNHNREYIVKYCQNIATIWVYLRITKFNDKSDITLVMNKAQGM